MARNNKLITGTIGSIYELRTVGQDNKSVVDFSVATTYSEQVDGKWEDVVTEWHNITAWGKLAENIANGWEVGDRVFIYAREGFKNGYTDKNGEERPARVHYTAEIAGHDNSWFASSQDRPKKGQGSQGGRRQQQESQGNRNERRGNTASSGRSAQKAPQRSRNKPEPAPVVENDDLFDDDTFDDGDDDFDEPPF